MSHDLTVPEADTQPPAPLPGLTHLQSEFVRAYVQAGDGNATAAVIAAGYSPHHAGVRGSRLLRMGAVQEAIQAETRTAIALTAPRMLAGMVKLAGGAKSEFVRQTALADLLDRAGYKPITGHAVAIGGGLTIDISLDLPKKG